MNQIYLAKFIHEHWAEFAGKFDGLIDLNYSFLHIDLANRPSDLFSQFPGGGWPCGAPFCCLSSPPASSLP